ncbi:hypothetical protein E4U54_003841 [Claviceps lovelessii]|nr:hypothetical protein E4U54_003841 [Claviceps lovelessii]
MSVPSLSAAPRLDASWARRAVWTLRIDHTSIIMDEAQARSDDSVAVPEPSPTIHHIKTGDGAASETGVVADTDEQANKRLLRKID